MTQFWKATNILKGLFTRIPPLDNMRRLSRSTGGTDSARYCYTIWLRHLVLLSHYGFRIRNANVAELGPGDSIGTGLAALLSGAESYVGLDIVPFFQQAELLQLFDELVSLYESRTSIPDHVEFPRVRPILNQYRFPTDLITLAGFEYRQAQVRTELIRGVNISSVIRYYAPWTSPRIIDAESLDLVFSQAVLEHVDDLENAYKAMFGWLHPGAYASHVVDLSAHYLSPYWNGHWAYTDWQWRLVRGRREFLLNRQPLSAHLELAKDLGFKVLSVHKDLDYGGLPVSRLATRFQRLDTVDYQTRVALIVLQKPE